ncbi:hypothetical protein ACOZFM_11165 [Streptomyces arboris]|uniref:hypothetical protein n=1 Tax=Streptomyces arboris TaxID=2600619 RepID=UPI003BF494CC
MASRGAPNLGIKAMPVLDVKVHEVVKISLKEYADERGVSVRTLVRELLYDFVRDEMHIVIDDVPPTKTTRK